jgi:hypothetical protein
MSKPFVVLIISISEDAFGVAVPIPALPLDGNVFWACDEPVIHTSIGKQINFIIVFILFYFFNE